MLHCHRSEETGPIVIRDGASYFFFPDCLGKKELRRRRRREGCPPQQERP